MAEDVDRMPEQANEIYGWCGLCHSFTQFPHGCPEQDRQIDEEAA